MLGGNGEAIVEDIKGWPELSPARDTPPGPDIAEENGGKPKKPGARSNPSQKNNSYDNCDTVRKYSFANE